MGQHLMLQYPLGMGKIHLVSSICSRRRAEDCTRNLPSMLHTLYRMTVLFHLRIYLATHAKQIHFIYVNNVPGICIKKNWVIPQMIELIVYFISLVRSFFSLFSLFIFLLSKRRGWFKLIINCELSSSTVAKWRMMTQKSCCNLTPLQEKPLQELT